MCLHNQTLSVALKIKMLSKQFQVRARVEVVLSSSLCLPNLQKEVSCMGMQVAWLQLW